MNPGRREMIRLMLGAAGGAAVLGGCKRYLRRSRARVVVVGGGYGGAACAKYLKQLEPALQVTLVEPKKRFVTCPFSNAAMAGLVPYKSLIRTYGFLKKDYGIDIVHARADRIDADKKTLLLENGVRLAYDRLVVSPGISMLWNESPDGYDMEAAEIMPHAWTGGPQTRILGQKLRNMSNGGVVVISVPPAPFRCPPGPYERASLMAYYLKTHKPRSKVLILNANTHFSKEDLFMEAWQELYADMIEYLPITNGGLVTAVTPARGLVHTDAGQIHADVANIIPSQVAGALARDNGLTDESGWCPVDHQTFESTLVPDVHVIGDSCLAGAMPKSASSANSQAKACSLALVSLLYNEDPVAPVYHNTCYSLAAPDYGFSINGMYRYHDRRITLIQKAGGLSPLKASREFRRREARYAHDWYDSINMDTFGGNATVTWPSADSE
ncbi:MAG: NAD(P)/FAD-dependent oxidoreductase [Gammaproteobacteria bacterium]